MGGVDLSPQRSFYSSLCRCARLQNKGLIMKPLYYLLNRLTCEPSISLKFPGGTKKSEMKEVLKTMIYRKMNSESTYDPMILPSFYMYSTGYHVPLSHLEWPKVRVFSHLTIQNRKASFDGEVNIRNSLSRKAA